MHKIGKRLGACETSLTNVWACTHSNNHLVSETLKLCLAFTDV
jgi:hypothetical protein